MSVDTGVKGSARDGFFSDVGAALRVWFAHPALPLLSFIVWGLPSLLPSSTAVSVIALPLGVFAVGYVGTERVWYAEGFEGRGVTAGDVWTLTWSFFGRFFVLGLWMTLLGVAAFFGSYAAFGHDLTKVFVVFGVISFLTDAILTFVTPALCFSTHRVSEALAVGLAMVRDQWPRSAVYVVVPPLALVVVARLFRALVDSYTPLAIVNVVSVLLYVLFKGATARFYLRHEPTGSDWRGPQPRGAERSSSPLGPAWQGPGSR